LNQTQTLIVAVFECPLMKVYMGKIAKKNENWSLKKVVKTASKSIFIEIFVIYDQN